MGANQNKGLNVMVGGTETIHSVIRRCLRNVATLDESRVTADNWGHYMEYVGLVLTLIEHHHDHEEHIVFAAVEAKKPNFLHQQFEEHKALMELLERGNKFIAETQVDAEALPQRLGELRELAKEIETLMDPHLRVEEERLNADFYRTEFTEKELLAIHAQIMQSVRKDPPHSAVFLCYHMEPQQRQLLSMPWFVRRFLFPKWAASKAHLWQFATHPTTRNGQYVFCA